MTQSTLAQPRVIRFSLAWTLQTILTIIYPVLTVLIAVRLVMTPLFLQIEYTRPGFPADYYGFTTEDRLNYAPYAVHYLLNSEDIDFLGDLTFPDGNSLFNMRELQHMRDVKIVTQIAFLVAVIMGILVILTAIYLYRVSRPTLLNGLRNGAVLTLVIILSIVIGAVFNWEYFFTAFHRIFFEDGTWMFLYSDTLIRLFPEQFWFDAALTIGGIVLITSLATIALTTWRLRSSQGTR